MSGAAEDRAVELTAARGRGLLVLAIQGRAFVSSVTAEFRGHGGGIHLTWVHSRVATWLAGQRLAEARWERGSRIVQITDAGRVLAARIEEGSPGVRPARARMAERAGPDLGAGG